jgi:hypothetical protein
MKHILSIALLSIALINPAQATLGAEERVVSQLSDNKNNTLVQSRCVRHPMCKPPVA